MRSHDAYSSKSELSKKRAEVIYNRARPFSHWTICFVLFLYVLIIAPFVYLANYPSLDEVIYSWSIDNFINTGYVNFLASSSSCFYLVISAAIILKLLGNSASVLHFISLLYAVFAALAVYSILLELRIHKKEAVFGATIFLINPFTMNLCLSYMTDLPAICFNSWSIYSIIMAWKTSKNKYWLLAILFICVSMACRQTAILLVPSLVFLLYKSYKNKRSDTILILLALILTSLFFIFLHKLLIELTVYPNAVLNHSRLVIEEIEKLFFLPYFCYSCLTELSKTFCSTSIFIFPMIYAYLSLVKVNKLRKILQNKYSIMLVFFAFCALLGSLLIIFYDHTYMPFYNCMWLPPFVGSYCLLGDLELWTSQQKFLLTIFCAVSSVALAAAFASVISFVYSSLDKRTKERSKNSSLEVICFLLLYLSSFLLFTVLELKVNGLDRYFLHLLVPFELCLFSVCRYFRFTFINRSVLICLSVLTVYSYASFLDYFSFSYSRWQAVSALIELGVAPTQIDAGPEFNLKSNPSLMANYTKSDLMNGWDMRYRGQSPRNLKRWWPITREKYILAFSLLNCYEPILEINFWSFLINKRMTIFVLKEK